MEGAGGEPRLPAPDHYSLNDHANSSMMNSHIHALLDRLQCPWAGLETAASKLPAFTACPDWASVNDPA